MKVEKTKPKRSISELPHGCKELIDKLHKCPENELVSELRKVNTWSFGKCELYHWVEVLNRFDGILAHATEAPANEECEYIYMCPKLTDRRLKEMVISVLHFTALLIEHSYARHIYNSMEHLNSLLSSTDLDVVIAVLNLIYVFSKRSNFLSRVTNKQKLKLNTFLETLGESWGGKENGLSLAVCCQESGHQLPVTATSVYFELMATPKGSAFVKQWSNSSSSSMQPVWLKDVDKDPSSLSDIMQQLTTQYSVSFSKQHQWIMLIVKIRLAKYFSDYKLRMKCIQARLQAIAILVYSGATTDVVDPLLYNGFVEELVEVLELKQPNLHEVKASCLRALTAMIHLERDPKLSAIIEATGASTYHGFLPSLVRECITSLTDTNAETYPQTFATALFSFLYHLATYEASGDALVSSGIMESLLQVVDWQSPDPSCITFVTRAVRVIDLITNLDMTAFHSLGGWNKLLWRLKHEVDCCKEELPFILPFEVPVQQQQQQQHEATEPQSSGAGDTVTAEAEQMNSSDQTTGEAGDVTEPVTEEMNTADIILEPAAASSNIQEDVAEPMELDQQIAIPITITTITPTELQCLPQRAALIKSILNFFKKAIPDPTFAENIRNLVDSSLPESLKHIVSNAEYYGPSIYLPATEVMTVFVFHEPSQLSALQDNGLPGVVLNSLLMKNIPATREVLGSVPNILSALCLNARGLQTFTDAQPFERLLKVLINPLYLPAMRRRKGTVDQIGDTVCNLGIAMDELMRHQPTLKASVIAGLIELLKQVRLLGLQQAVSVTNSSTSSQKVSTEAGCSDEEDDDIDDEVASTTSRKSQAEDGRNVSSKKAAASVPIMEYVLHVVHFLDAILSTNSTDDHIKEFMQQGGLPPLLDLATMVSLPLDFATSNACSAIATACKGILHIGHEPLVMMELFKKLNTLLQNVECFVNSPKSAEGSVLLEEVTTCSSVEDVSESYIDTPVLHNLACLNSLLTLCVQLSRTNQIEPRVITVNQWGSPDGVHILQSLLALYRALLWEGFTLLAIADSYKEETDKQEQLPADGSNVDLPLVCDEVMPKSGHSSPSLKHLSPSLKHLTPLVAVTSRVGKSIAELLSLLVRLATGPLHRHHRRSLHTPVISQPPPKEAVNMCQSITSVLVDGLCWNVPLPRLQPCVLTSSLGQWLFEGMTFTLYLVEMSEFLLFDDRKRPYHLMLMHFDKFNGLNALTECFNKAMAALKSTKNTNIDGSCVDFLDGWLNLVEKLLNTQSIIDSPHTVVSTSTSAATNRQQVTFDAITFVMKAQQCLAPCLLELWDSRLLERFTPHVVELLLSCLRLLVTGEQMINNHMEKKGKSSSSTAKDGQSSASVGPLHHAASTLPTTGRIDAVSLQQLMDMGFTRDHATDALLVCGNNLTAAMEWILSHPPAEDATTSEADALLVSGGLSEEEQMMRAIALSLEQGGEGEGSSSSGDKKADDKKAEPEEPKEITPQPLDRSVLDGFTSNLMANCLKLIDTVPDAAHKLCSLFTAVGRRNGLEWQESAMLQLRDEALIPLCHEVVQIYSDNGRKDNSCDAKLKCRLHLVALLLEEMPKVCADVFCVPELRQLLIQLLQLVSKDDNTFLCPLWLIGLLLLMDSIERVVLYCKWKFSTKENHDYVWQWFDEIAHRWCSYSTEDSGAMERAYQAAEPSVKVSSGRQRYVVQFGPMMQVNVDTGTRRPVMRTPILKTKSKESDKKSSSKAETDNKPASKAEEDKTPNVKVALESVATSSTQEAPVTTKEQPEQCFTGFTLQESLEIIKNCTQLIACPLDQDTLHAALRLCLRFTRDHLHAEEFVNCGGPQALLAKKRDSSFKGFLSLTILLLRHVMECNSTLSQTMENVIRTVVTNNRPSLSREHSYSSGHRELYLVMRRLAPLACRNVDKFMEKSSSLLRVNSRPAKIEQHRSGGGHRIPATMVHCTSSSQQKPTTLPVLTLHVEVINMLIDRLCTAEEGVKVQQTISSLDSNQLLYDSSSDTVHVQMGNVHVAGNERLSARAVSLTRDTTGNRGQRGQTLRSRPAEDDDDTSEDMNVEYNSSQAASPERKESKDATSTVNVQQTEHILSKAGLMRLLTELIDSYPNCCQIVSESIRNIVINGESKQMSFLAYVMEYLLPPDPTATSIPNISRQSKNFLQYVAMSTVSSTQSVFVHEFKNCFAHALLLPESLVKHNWLRSLANLLSAILDKQTSLSARTAARMLVRKGIITDLARAVHCLDLNSSHLVSTINTILKPLESLTRFVNQVSALHHKHASGDAKSAAATATEATVNSGQSQPSNGGQENATGEQSQSNDQQVNVTDSQPVQNMDSSSLFDAVQSESLVPLEEEPQVEEEEDGEEEGRGLLYPAANIVGELVEGLIEEALLEREQSPSEDNSISDMETASDEESDEPADVEDNCNSAGEEQESDEEESQDVVEEDEPDNMMLHYDEEDDDEDDSSSHDHVSHQSEQDDEQSEELSSTSEDNITDMIHEEIDMIPGEVATSTTVHDEEQEEENEDEDEEDEESLDLDDMDAEYDHDFDVYHDPEDYVHVGIPYSSWREISGGWEQHLQHSGLLTRHLHPAGGGAYSIMESTDHVSSSSSAATTSQLPARHPMLAHQDMQQEHSSSLGFATYREINVTAASHSLPAIDHSENTIPQSSSALAQLLSTSSAHDVLRLNRSSLSTPQPSAATAASVNATTSHDSNRTDTEDFGNLTNIPSTYSRWTEECEALDGSIQHLCINSLKPTIISALEQTYEEESKRKGESKDDDKGSTSAATTDSMASSSLERTVRNRIASATASVTSAIDNLHASLQSVANSLVGTVDMVRSGLNSAAPVAAVTARNRDTGGGQESTTGGQESTTEGQNDNTAATTTTAAASTESTTVDGNVIEPMASSLSSDNNAATSEAQLLAVVEPPPPPLLPVSIALPTSTTVTTPVNSSLLSTTTTPAQTTTNSATPTSLFDGSQESAAAVLQNTDPADPMYMFLSAVAGAPAPPIPQSSRSDALRIASHIADMLHSDTLPLADDEDDDDDEEDDEEEQDELIGIVDRAAITVGTITTTSISTPLISALTVSATSSNSTSPCTTLAPQLSTGLQVQPSVSESLSSGRSEMVGDIIPLQSSALVGTITTISPSTSTSNNIATSTASTATGDALSSMPEELDSTFLEALPESIREELISQHAAEMHRRRLQARQTGNDASDSNFVSTISPEFLAALPPSIQEEVLAQERQQAAAAAASQTANQQNQQPTDPISFLRNLPTSLRRTVLADMDDSILQHLPHEYVTEAQTLRQEHTRQMYEERSAALLEHVMNSSGWISDAAVSGLIPHRHLLIDPLRTGWRNRPNMGASGSSALQTGKKGEAAKQMLDQEGLACLLLLFFIDQNKLHVSRLHRVIKNLCQHPQTRAWMLASILSILQESCCSSSLLSSGDQPPEVVYVVTGAAHNTGNFSWLNLSISAALGCHAPVLHFNKTASANSVTIHPYASSILSNCMLELLIFLARLFPDSFLPQQLMPGEHKETNKTVISNFWQLLLKLDSMNSKKGKGSSKAFVLKDDSREQKESELFSSSIVGQLMKMFNHPIIHESTSLTDKLFRLLALVTASIPKTGFAKKGARSKDQGKDENKSQSSDQNKDENKTEGEDGNKDIPADSQPEDSSSKKQEESEMMPIPDVEVVSKIQYSQEECGCSGDIAVFDASLCPSVEQRLLEDTIHTLIVGKCSEDGLEDATQFLIQLSRADNSTREIVLTLLLKGVCSLGENVCQQINALLLQLEENKANYSRQSSIDDESPAATTAAAVIAPSALTAAMVGRNTTDHSHDIHLPAMVLLSCKASQQSFFLRLLKVVCQLRESALNAVNSNRLSSTRNSLLSEEPPDANSTAAPSANADEMVVPTETNSNDQPHASDDVQPKEEQVVSKPTSTSTLQQQHSPSVIKPLSSLLGLTNLWDTLSLCLCSLADTHDSHAVLVLQPAVEAFFLVHAERSSDTKLPSGSRSSHSISTSRLKEDVNPMSPAAFSDLSPHPSQSEIEQDQYAQLPQDTVLFLKFADKHRVVLNQILRQSTIPLADGPFAMLVNHTKVLDFDVKRRYFRQEMERLEEGSRRNDLVVHVRRDHVFEDSFRELHRRSPEEMKSNLYISFEGEEGQDAGGLLREWYLIISREIFNPNYALFTTTPGDKTTYMPNSSSHINPDHLNYFKFVGKIIAKAIYDNKLLECYFTRSFYKHILGKHVHYTDMQAEDYSFYQGMVFLLEHDLNEIGAELTFSTEVQEFGLTEIRDLKANGRNIPVSEENKREYVQLACQMKMTSSIRAQIKSFLEGFYEIIPKKLISIFNEQELELLISGMPTIDIDDLKQNTEYNKYTESSLQIQWFWRAMKSFEQEDRARFLQFVTGTSRVPLQGFASLEGMNGPQKFQIHRDDRSTERLPCAHTCFNQLDLPPYETYNKLRTQLLLAIRECPEGFGFA